MDRLINYFFHQFVCFHTFVMLVAPFLQGKGRRVLQPEPLPLPSGVKISHMAVAPEGGHGVMISDSGEVYFVGTSKRGEDGEGWFDHNRSKEMLSKSNPPDGVLHRDSKIKRNMSDYGNKKTSFRFICFSQYTIWLLGYECRNAFATPMPGAVVV